MHSVPSHADPLASRIQHLIIKHSAIKSVNKITLKAEQAWQLPPPTLSQEAERGTATGTKGQKRPHQEFLPSCKLINGERGEGPVYPPTRVTDRLNTRLHGCQALLIYRAQCKHHGPVDMCQTSYMYCSVTVTWNNSI